MAASSTIQTLLSFILPPKPYPPPPTVHLNLPPSPTPTPSHKSPHNSPPQQLSLEDSSSSSRELSSVICPSLAYANTLYFKSTYNVEVMARENETEERLLNRFRREVMRAGVVQECKRRRFFENTQDLKKRKSREAAMRNRIRRPASKTLAQNKQDASPTKKDKDEEDNWDLPEGDTLY